MKADLADAQACIDWTVAQFPAFEKRIASWLNAHIDVGFIQMELPHTHDFVMAKERAEIPLTFNVEAGIYIHALRSSLDMLAWAIGKREQVLHPDQIYFPFAPSRADFEAGNYRG